MLHKTAPIEQLDAVIRRLGSGGDLVVHLAFADVMQGAADPLGIITYLAGLGIVVREIEDLLLVNQLEDEEELSAHRVAEGVAVATASQGEWVLFRSTPDTGEIEDMPI